MEENKTEEKQEEITPVTNYYVSEVDGEKCINLKTWGARENFMRYLGRTDNFDEKGNPRYRLKRVLEGAESLISRFEDDSDFKDLHEFVTKIWEDANKQALEEIRGTGKLIFSWLPLFYKKGLEVYVDQGEESFGGPVDRIRIVRSMFGTYAVLSIQTIEQIGDKIQPRLRSVEIPYFVDKKSVGELKATVITPEQKSALVERGRLFRDLSDGPHYMAYKGNVVKLLWYSGIKYRSDGRILVDGAGFRRFDNSQCDRVEYATDSIEGSRDSDESITISDELLWTCSPHVYGFSFSCKMWGQFLISGIQPVKFRKDAIDKLVMNEDRKKLILALVKHNKDSFSDIIEGKGGGCMFLLHGEPGLGKTLTAEAVSEFLERPLYSISMGEMGTEPSEIEENLRNVLELAGTWNAVVLLDEADIFLERRTTGDVHRNAIVGIFLRLLEYHNGVLFMTSNRVNEFDPAFKSRISAIIHYPKMDTGTRIKIWTNLLESAQISHLDAQELAEMGKLNGRQIKNVIRSALILAKSEDRQVSTDDIKRCMALIDIDEV